MQLVETTGAGFPESTSAVASFNEVPDVRAPDNPFASSLDTCFITQDRDANPPFLGSPGGVIPGRDLDAGEAITVFAGEQTLTTLRREDGDDPFYLQDDQSLGALPEVPLSVSVPGAEFPAFERASFVGAPRLALGAPEASEPITPESTFTWTPFTPADGYSAVFLSAVQLDPEAPENGVFLACLASNDGTFAFPEATKAELEAAGFVGGELFAVGRFTSRVERAEGAALYLQTLRQEVLFTGSGL